MSFISQFSKLDFPLMGMVRLPEIKIPTGQKTSLGLKPTCDNLTFLKKCAWLGYQKLKAEGKMDYIEEAEVIARLKLEFDVFVKTGTIDYILIIYQLVLWCDANNIVRGPGRGSCGGSFAFYCLNIIKNIDPIKYKLVFTRFISEVRVKPKVIDGIIYVDGKMLMDVDIDIANLDRAKVIKYLEAEYPSATCKIANRVGLSPKIAIKDAVKVYLNYEESEAKHISDNIEVNFGKAQSLTKALEKQPNLQEWVAASPRNARAYKIARGLENLNNNKSVHASGTFIYHTALDGNVPLELSKDKQVTTAYDMEIAGQIGPKLDLLGLKNLDIIALCCKKANVKVDEIDIHHESIYNYLANNNLYYGLFQIEAGLTKEATVKIKPKSISHLSAILAVSRPGAFKSIDDLAKFTNEGEMKPIHPKMDEILGETGNILLYQEQVSRILQEVYGFTATEAENERRVIGKKAKDEIAALEPKLYERGKKNGIPDEITKYFWDICNASADYLFNASHSHLYAVLTAQTTFLKANYPHEFVYALLSLAKNEPDATGAIAAILSEAKKMSIAVLPPDITRSSDDFTIYEKEGKKEILFGLGSVKGVSETTMAKLLLFRREFTNKFEIFEAAKVAKIPINVLSGLIFSGTLRAGTTSRALLVFEAQLYNELTDKEKLLVHTLASEFQEDLVEIVKSLKIRLNEKGKSLIRESRYATIQRDSKPYYDMYLSNSKNERLCSYLSEKHFLGFSYTSDLHSIYAERVENLVTLENACELPEKTGFRCVCFISEGKKVISKAGKTYYNFYANDDTLPEFKFMLFGGGKSEWGRADKIEACIKVNGRIPEEGDIVIINASKVSGSAAFVENIVLQENPLKIRKSQLEVEL